MFSGKHKSAVRKALAVCNAASQGNFEVRVTNITETGEAGEMLNAINRIIDIADAYVRETRASLEYVVENKYFRKISEKGMPGAFGEASRTINTAMETMEKRVGSFASVVKTFDL